MSVAQYVTSQINSSRIVIFSKTYCPYCIRAKNLFKSINQNATVIELDTMDQGDQIQDHLYQVTRQRTVPSIFIDQKHVGGCDDVHALHRNGKLAAMLK